MTEDSWLLLGEHSGRHFRMDFHLWIGWWARKDFYLKQIIEKQGFDFIKTKYIPLFKGKFDTTLLPSSQSCRISPSFTNRALTLPIIIASMDFDELFAITWPSPSDGNETETAPTFSPEILPTQLPGNCPPPLDKSNRDYVEPEEDKPTTKMSRNLRGRRQPALDAMTNWKNHTLRVEAISDIQEMCLFLGKRFSCNIDTDEHRIKTCNLVNDEITLENEKEKLLQKLEEAGIIKTKTK